MLGKHSKSINELLNAISSAMEAGPDKDYRDIRKTMKLGPMQIMFF
jgi:hypothetical protein